MNLDIMGDKIGDSIKGLQESHLESSHDMSDFRQWVVAKLD